MRILITITLVLSQFSSFGQGIAHCIEILGKDSLKFYFKSQGILSDKECFDYYRFAKMNSENFVFNGSSKDYYSTGQLATDCHYLNNLYQGDYISYYSNGQVKEKGKFNEGQKIGRWEYWYENGRLRKIIIFEDDDYFLKDFYKSNGKQMVIDGNGVFSEEYIHPGVIMRGDIKNGKQNGKWIISNKVSKEMTGIEYFKNGKFIEGQSIAQIDSFNDKYFDFPYSLIDLTEDLIQSYYRKIDCKLYETKRKKYNSNSSLPFFDYVYQNFDPPILQNGYILAGFTIDKLGKLINTEIYTTINDRSIEDQLLNVLHSSETWEPVTRNGIPNESTELLVFQFFNGTYKILGDSRNDYAPVEYGAEFIYGLDSLKNLIEKSINLPKYFFGKGYNLSASISFNIDENGTCIDDNGVFLVLDKVTDDERILYNALISMFKNMNKQWKPATYNGKLTKHYFNGVFTIRDGVPKFRLFSNNWVLK